MVDTLCLNTRTVKAPVTQGVTHCVQGTDLSELTQFVPGSDSSNSYDQEQHQGRPRRDNPL